MNRVLIILMAISSLTIAGRLVRKAKGRSFLGQPAHFTEHEASNAPFASNSSCVVVAGSPPARPLARVGSPPASPAAFLWKVRVTAYCPGSCWRAAWKADTQVTPDIGVTICIGMAISETPD